MQIVRDGCVLLLLVHIAYSMLSTLVHYYINALNDVMVAIVKLSRQIENLTPSIDAY